MTNIELADKAAAAGMTFFFTTPCKKCGTEWRYVSSPRACVTCTRARCKKYNHAHKDRMLELQRNWRKDNAEYYRSWKLVNETFGAKPAVKYGE